MTGVSETFVPAFCGTVICRSDVSESTVSKTGVSVPQRTAESLSPSLVLSYHITRGSSKPQRASARARTHTHTHTHTHTQSHCAGFQEEAPLEAGVLLPHLRPETLGAG